MDLDDSDAEGEAYTEINLDKSGKPIVFPDKRTPFPLPRAVSFEHQMQSRKLYSTITSVLDTC